MEREITIRIKEGPDEEPILITRGSVLRVGNSWNVRYGGDDGSFVIGVSDGIITVTREGEEGYSIMLCEGRDHSFDITTPFGDIPMKVIPDRVYFEERENGLGIELRYTLTDGQEEHSFGLFLDCVYCD